MFSNDPHVNNKIKHYVYNMNMQHANQLKNLENEINGYKILIQNFNEKEKHKHHEEVTGKNKYKKMNEEHELLLEKIKQLENTIEEKDEKLNMYVTKENMNKNAATLLKKEVNDKKNAMKLLEDEIEKLKKSSPTTETIGGNSYDNDEIMKLKEQIEANKNSYNEKIKTLKEELNEKKKLIDKFNKIIVKNNEYFKQITDNLSYKEKIIDDLSTKYEELKEKDKNREIEEELKVKIKCLEEQKHLKNGYIFQSVTYS